MEKKRKQNWKRMAWIPAFIAAALCLWQGGKWMVRAAGGESAGGTHVLTCYDTRYDEGPLMVGYFEIDGGIPAMCVCHEMDPPTRTGTILTRTGVCTEENQRNELLRKIYYYGWKGPEDVGASYVETCLAGSVANGHSDNYYGYGQAFIERIADLPGAPRGFDVYLISDGGTATQELAYWEYHPFGTVKLKKAGTWQELTEGNACYSLQGAEYGVYKEESCENRLALLVTDADGETGTAELEPGDYYVKELKAPAGYRLDTRVYPVRVEAQETAVVEAEDIPVWNTMNLSVFKQDAETGESRPAGSASLAGARFEVCFYEGYYTWEDLPVEPDRTWILETKEEEVSGEVKYLFRLEPEYLTEGDPFYEADGQSVLPLGTITVEETEAPEGYRLEEYTVENEAGVVREGKYLTQIRQQGDLAEIEGGHTCAVSDHVIRGDLDLVKIADGSHRRLAGVPFRITSNTTGESHVIVTDGNGQASTASEWNPHSRETNRGETEEDGVWFGMKADGTVSEADDGRGALPYDTYTIEELPCESNQGYELIPPFTVSIRKDRITVHLGTMTNDEPEEEEPEQPEEVPESSGPQPSVRTGDTSAVRILLAGCILSCVAVASCVMIVRKMRK